MSNRVYCHGDLVNTFIVDGWYACGGCGHYLWPVDATFAVNDPGLPSVHGYQDENQDDREEAGSVRGGSAEAGGV